MRIAYFDYFAGISGDMFLGALIESISDGVPGPQPVLTARNIFSAAASRIDDARASGVKVPVPYIRTAGRSEIPLCRNRKYLQPTPPVDDELLGYVPVFMTSGDCFDAIRQAHIKGRDDSIARIINTFAANKDSDLAEVAALVKALSASEFSHYRDRAYFAVCAKRSPADIAEFVDCLHSSDAEVDAGLLVKCLEERDDAGVAGDDVYWHLRGNGCNDCADEAENIAAQIVGNAKLSAGVLAIWR